MVAVIAVLVAGAAVASRHSRKISLFGDNRKSSNCSEDSWKFNGVDDDCHCDYETVDSLNEQVLYPLLQELVTTPFFKYFKVCHVVFGKQKWKKKTLRSSCGIPLKKPCTSSRSPYANLMCQEGKKPQDTVDRRPDVKDFFHWTERDNPWTHDDEMDGCEMSYVNLQLNPERYASYGGPSAIRIWDAIYSENCPKCGFLVKFEFSKINVEGVLQKKWGNNPELMYDCVLRYPERVKNLYFTFLFVLRAMTKLVYNPKLQAACPLPFDESKLWQDQKGPQLKQQIQQQFRNISSLIDCVQCEKAIFGEASSSWSGHRIKDPLLC
ncbi:unnamed protein product [Thlaspi arvense]|uniref:Uncharacterized protein n=1 Tax=Thlaspi arvense TaxID=13288 RepID=A0AAU9SN54_THLAR|nr:unnamed protein product [Thlaspi arvense]